MIIKNLRDKIVISSASTLINDISPIKQQSSTKEVVEKPAVAASTERTPPPLPNKRSRPDDDEDEETRISPNRNKDLTPTKQLKQPKLTLNESGSLQISNFTKSNSPSPGSRAKRSNNTLIDLFQNKSPSTPSLLVPKSLLRERDNTTDKMSPFSVSEKKSLFQNQIGSPGIIRASPRGSSSTSSFDSSFSDRIDLHMCNRATAVLDSPEIRSKNEGRKIDKNKQSEYRA